MSNQSAYPDLAGQTILQIIPDLAAGGAERTTVEMAEAITEAGGRALVISQGGRLEHALTKAGGELIRMKVGSKNPITIRSNAKAIEKIISEQCVTLIHARSRAPAWSAHIAATATKTPFVTTYHGAYSGISGLKRYYNSVMAKGELIIANSEWTAAHVAAVHNIDKDRIVTIPRGVDFEAFDPAKVTSARQHDLQKAWNIDDSDKRLQLVLPGRLTAWKGQKLAIEAIASLSGAERSKLHLVLAGDAQGRDKYVTALENAIIENGLGGTVSIAGHCADMPAAYAIADIVLAPSTRPEAFGRVAAEASAMGRPVIVADHGGQRETVVEGETGTRAEPGSAPALAACIRTMMSLPDTARKAMGEAGKAYVLTRFSKKQLQSATLNVYARVLNIAPLVENTAK